MTASCQESEESRLHLSVLTSLYIEIFAITDQDYFTINVTQYWETEAPGTHNLGEASPQFCVTGRPG